MSSVATISAVPDQYKVMLDNYASILEKTNNQLGLWLSLSNLAVGILSVIIAIVAILVGYALWKNSNEQKKQFKEFLETQEKISKENITRLEESLKKVREESEKKLEILINEQQKKLSSATVENKKEIQKAIDDLKKEKATVGISLGSIAGYQPVFPSYSTVGPTGYSIPFVGTTTTSQLGPSVSMSTSVCSRCGTQHPTGSLYCPYFSSTKI